MKKLLLFVLLASVALAQTTINGGRVITGAWDASGATTTKPAKVGSGVPASGDCDVAGEVGRLYVRSDPAAVNATQYVCANTGAATYAWELVKGGTVTSVGLVGTADQITVTGTSPITGSGSWTLSFPTNVTLPGTTTGTFSGNISGTAGGLSATLAENRFPALDGDVTTTAGDLTTAIAANAVTPAKASAVMRTRSLTVVITGSGTAGVLQDADDQPSVWYNSLGQGVTVTAVSCKTDSATASRIQFQRDDGTPASVLTDNAGAGVDCSSTRASGTIDTNEDNFASTNGLNFVMVTAGGAGKWVSVTVTYTLD